jgi:molybdenum cofactor cytidylyltransferase
MPDAGNASTAGRGQVAALLLAAGESTRMARAKQLLEWAGQPLIEYQVAELRAAGCDPVVAVLGHRAEEIRGFAEAAGATTVLNSAYKNGRAGSIRTGAMALPDDVTAVVILNVDQPRKRSIISRLISAHLDNRNLITVPICKGRHGHPAIISGELLGELRQVDEATEGLRAVMRRHASERREFAIDDASVLFDLNTPADYEAARAAIEQTSIEHDASMTDKL